MDAVPSPVRESSEEDERKALADAAHAFNKKHPEKSFKESLIIVSKALEYRKKHPKKSLAECLGIVTQIDPADVLDDDFRDVLMSGQSLGSLLLGYLECERCRHVYKMWTDTAHSCPACKGEVRTGLVYSPMTIISLIDLIQDLYRMELTRTSAIEEKIVEKKEARHHVGILLLFCTLVECWMEYLLRALMESRHLPEQIIDRLLSDNWRLEARTKKLFKTLTGKAFGDALRDLTKENKKKGGDLNYEAVWSFVQDVIEKRNKVVHKGAIYILPEHLVEECISYIERVGLLFIALQNQYIVQGADSHGAGQDATSPAPDRRDGRGD